MNLFGTFWRIFSSASKTTMTVKFVRIPTEDMTYCDTRIAVAHVFAAEFSPLFDASSIVLFAQHNDEQKKKQSQFKNNNKSLISGRKQVYISSFQFDCLVGQKKPICFLIPRNKKVLVDAHSRSRIWWLSSVFVRILLENGFLPFCAKTPKRPTRTLSMSNGVFFTRRTLTLWNAARKEVFLSMKNT